ncbi:MAG: class I SAM-dependent methyltransferase [Anaerolineales bacterium]
MKTTRQTLNGDYPEKLFHGTPDSLRSPERLARLEVERVIELSLKGISVNKLLDIGTGSGIFAEAFAKIVPSVMGIDISEKMLAYARNIIPNVQFQNAKMESLPFEDSAFDLIFFGTALHEGENLEQTLAEAKRCAKQRIAALEWQYREEPFGPPLIHRLKPERLIHLAKQLDFSTFEIVPLKEMMFYRFDIVKS